MVCNQPGRCHLDVIIYCVQGTVDEMFSEEGAGMSSSGH